MKNDSPEKQAVEAAITAKGIVRKAVEERMGQQEVFDAAKQAALLKIRAGADEADTYFAAGMAYFRLIKETCGSEDSDEEHVPPTLEKMIETVIQQGTVKLKTGETGIARKLEVTPEGISVEVHGDEHHEVMLEEIEEIVFVG